MISQQHTDTVSHASTVFAVGAAAYSVLATVSLIVQIVAGTLAAVSAAFAIRHYWRNRHK